MGTRGYRAVRRKGKYFITYNHWDSYPSGLGKDIVDSIPTDPGAYQKWLQETIEYWDGIYEQLCDENGDFLEEGDEGAPETEFALYPSQIPPQLDIFIEWTYTIDLDRMAFTVDSQAHFRLDSIPRSIRDDAEDEWASYLDVDRNGERCLNPNTPREYVADISLPPPEVDATGLDIYRSLESFIAVDSEAFAPIEDNLEHKTAVSNTFKELKDYYSYFTRAPEMQKDNPHFKATALALLTTASPSFFQTAAAFAGGSKNLPNRFKNFIDNTRSHSSFWIRGVLVHLSGHLESEEHLASQLGPLIQRLQLERERAKEPQLIGLLWSAKAFVIAKVTATSIIRSPVYPILNLFGVPQGIELVKKNLSILPPLLQMKATHTAPFFSARIPLELLELILENVQDEATYLAFAPLCKTLFYYVLSHPHPHYEEQSLLSNYRWE